MTVYSVHIICDVCGNIIFMSEPLTEEELPAYLGSIITPDIVKVMDICNNQYLTNETTKNILVH